MYEYRVKQVIKIVDGDTLDIEIDLGFNLSYKQRVRLAGIDAPESRTTNLKEKALGLEVKEYLKRCLENSHDIIIQTEKADNSEKYGSILGWIFLDDDEISINEKMINEGYAWEYDGGTKKKDFDSLLAKRVK